MLPKDKAGEWHLTHLDHVLIIEAVNGEVADPRASGKVVRLTS